MNELSDRSRKILDLEKLWFQYGGIKEQQVRAELGVSMIGYYQELNKLIDTEAALAYDPHTVKRLQARRTASKRSRGVAPFGN